MTLEEPLVYGLAWSPDGREVWYSAATVQGGADRAVYAVTLNGTKRLVARMPGAMTVFDVGPDGKTALVSTGAAWQSINAILPGRPDEQSLDLRGRSQPAGLSADGKWVLINEDREVGTGGYLKSIDGRKTMELGPQRPLALRPDGAVALMVDRSNAARVQLVPAGPGVPTNLALPPGHETTGGNRWSRDGRRLFMCLRPSGPPSPCRIWMREGEEPWQVVTPALGDPAFTVRRDGGMIAARDTSFALWLFPVDGGTPARVEGESRVAIHWTDDGRELIVRDPPSVVARLYRHDLRTGRTTFWRELAPADRAGVFSVLSVLISADMQTVVYQSFRATNELFLAQGLR